MAQMPSLFCFGLGFSAQTLAARLKSKGWRVAGTTRSPERAEALTAAGYEVFMFGPEGPVPDLGAALSGASHVLVSVPPGPAGDPVLSIQGRGPSPLKGTRWLGYLSTTGVYGDHGGDWVDEQTPVSPSSERAKRRVAVEHAWQVLGSAFKVPVHVFRLAGIYGPGRNQLESLRDGSARRIVKTGQVFSRIHVEDIATVLEASIARPNAGAIYNVCDDEPAPPHEVVEYAAKLLGIPPPPLEQFDEAARTMSEMALSFYADSKRVKNDRMKNELGVSLRYPTYREGLMALRK